MQIIIDIFNLILLAPLVNLLVFIFRVFEAANIPGALGLAIVVLTILIRFLIWPFIGAQLRSAKKMADLKPHLDELRKKHTDRQVLAKAQMDLYKEHGVSPAGGCLPAIIQIIITIALYQAIITLFSGPDGLNRINNLLYFSDWRLQTPPDPYFLGLDQSLRPQDYLKQLAANPFFAVFALAVPIITAALQFIQTKMMMPVPVKPYPNDTKKEKEEKKSTEDTMMAFQGQMMYLMPMMIGYFAFTFPLGLAVYWNVLTLVGIFQQYRITGWGSLPSMFKRFTTKK